MIITTSSLITKAGTFNTPQGQEIVVEIDDSPLVRYSVTKGDTTLIRSRRHFSHVHRWALQWDAESRLWVWSSDIGGVVWVPEGESSYREVALHEDPDTIAKIPRELFDYLPSSTKTEWKGRR